MHPTNALQPRISQSDARRRLRELSIQAVREAVELHDRESRRVAELALLAAAVGQDDPEARRHVRYAENARQSSVFRLDWLIRTLPGDPEAVRLGGRTLRVDYDSGRVESLDAAAATGVDVFDLDPPAA